MSQINEGWASRTQEERDEMTKKEREQRILALSKKYGSKKVKQAQKEADDDNRRKGKSVRRNQPSWKELQARIENSKDRLKKGEVKRWDKEEGRWVSNKEDVNEEPNWNDGVNIRWNIGPNKKEVSLNVNGATIASKKKETWTGKTKPKFAVDKGLIDLKNKETEHLAQNFIKNNPLKTKKSVNEDAPPTEKHERMVKHIKKSYKKDGKLTDQEKSIAYATAWKNYNKEKAK